MRLVDRALSAFIRVCARRLGRMTGQTEQQVMMSLRTAKRRETGVKALRKFTSDSLEKLAEEEKEETKT